MTLGDGILWSTVLILLAAAIYQISVRHKWKLVGITIGTLIASGGIIGAGVWAWAAYKDRPYVVEEYRDIKLGMRQVDVTLLKGAPDENHSGDVDYNEKSGTYSLVLIFDYVNNGGSYLAVVFVGDSESSLVVNRVCRKGGYSDLLGFGPLDTELEVIKKLGEPSRVSIDSKGLSKWINYEQWNVVYEITEGNVDIRCMTKSPMSYKDEFGQESEKESALNPE